MLVNVAHSQCSFGVRNHFLNRFSVFDPGVPCDRDRLSIAITSWWYLLGPMLGTFVAHVAQGPGEVQFSARLSDRSAAAERIVGRCWPVILSPYLPTEF